MYLIFMSMGCRIFAWVFVGIIVYYNIVDGVSILWSLPLIVVILLVAYIFGDKKKKSDLE